MVRVVRSGQSGELVAMGIPVEVAAVNNTAANLCGMSVHILCGRVSDNVGTPLKGTAVDGSGEGVIDNKGYAVLVGNAGKLLDIQYLTARIGDGFTKQGLGVGTECLVDFLLAGLLRNERAVDAQFLQRDTKEVVSATIDLIGGDKVVASLTDVEQGIEVCGLSAGGQHSANTTFQGCYL